MKLKIFKVFRVAYCECGHSWTTEASAKNIKCSECEKRLRKMKKRYPLRPVPTKMMEETSKTIHVHIYFGILEPRFINERRI